jgi:hypothetical protein
LSGVTVERPDLGLELSVLKDFQRLSVETVFQRLYLDQKPTRRFLIADEVGLGKTLVARGIIARAIDHLWEKTQRIDIIYLCSNADIARQNVRRLTPHDIEGVSLASRITLLPLTTHDFSQRKVNVVALTPGTSLNLRGNLGIKQERALLFEILAPHWGLDRTGAIRLFAGNATLSNFRYYLHWFRENQTIDVGLKAAFIAAAEATHTEGRMIRNRVEALVRDFRDRSKPDAGMLAARNELIGDLRQILARSCINALQPDLIILDEFQRFKELLDGQGPAAEMARELFEYEDESTKTRVLMLSATPYKMYTVQDEAGNENHYADFLRTLQFLFNEHPTTAESVSLLLKAYRQELFKIDRADLTTLRSVRDDIEATLRQVMVRTERLAVTADRSGMLVEKPIDGLCVVPKDARAYASMQRLARLTNSPDTMEYWKASPWLLNFMDEYKLRKDVDELVKEPRQSKKFVHQIAANSATLLSSRDVVEFRPLDAPHPKLRWLVDELLGRDQWKLLWIPAALPYYSMAGPFNSGVDTAVTKTLVFSAWRIVPRVIASALSHEAERLMYVGFEGPTGRLHDAPVRLADMLSVSRKSNRTTTGLSALTLLYPCAWLAEQCDPLDLSRAYANTNGRSPSFPELREMAEQRIAAALTDLIPLTPARTTPDESWYWATPILLDNDLGSAQAEWIDGELATIQALPGHNPVYDDDEDEEDERLDTDDAQGSDVALTELVRRARAIIHDGWLPTGMPPKDLLSTLAVIALGSPAIAALRAVSRITDDSTRRRAYGRSSAARIGAAFRTLFNQPDSAAIVRGTMTDGQDYWKQCLEYCGSGCIQSVLDEYAHLLVGEAGVFGKDSEQIVTAVSEYMVRTVTLRRARVGAHDFSIADGKVRTAPLIFRSRFAMRFGEERADESGDKVRADEVRHAFNSPFWPFVLATTSVGQEGLDFHHYCHRVVHWNLPPNPVDLEQREGRVHRFKGHAVRKNVAHQHSDAWRDTSSADPWETAFSAAKDGREPGTNDLVPFWVYPIPGGAAIERYVPNLPLSRDVERYKSLRESLAIYRMVFGQPRQEELLSYLRRVIAPEMIPQLQDELRISLAPRSPA